MGWAETWAWATDDAFLDRADIKQYIGLPTRAAIYEILRACVHELMRVGIVAPAVPLMERQVVEYLQDPGQQGGTGDAARASRRLLTLAAGCEVPRARHTRPTHLTRRDRA
jgi:pachytene checkpoint protein 2